MGNGNCKRCYKEMEEIINECIFNFKNMKKKEIDFTKLNKNMSDKTINEFEVKSKEKEESKKYIEY